MTRDSLHPTPPPCDDDARWAAVCARDVRADGHFVYAVSTTGVYCRPSCGSRAARRENVRFHANPAEAERAGFRACKRCHPGGPTLAERHAALVTAACRTLDTGEPGPDLTTLAAAAGLSPHHFHRIFRAITGVTPKAYAAARRAQRVQRGLPKAATVTEALYEAGYPSSARFYGEAPSVLGMRPTTFKAGGERETIRFAIGTCSMGEVLVAGTSVGLCAIWLGDRADALLDELQARFPRAELRGGDAAFDATVGQVLALADDPSRGLDLPLDIRGTAFQRRVWQALRDIPPGITRSYAQVAEAMGEPNSARAVAAACAANALAIAVPCHRVVRSDGGLSGYRWGVARKQALLEREGGPR